MTRKASYIWLKVNSVAKTHLHKHIAELSLTSFMETRMRMK